MDEDKVSRATKAAIKTLDELLPGHKVVVLIERPDGLVHFGSLIGGLDLSNLVCSAGWHMAARVPPNVQPTHDRPEMVQ
jgi:hypothetical protein